MTCDGITELVSAGIDGELTDTETADLESHVSECPACWARSMLMGKQNDMLRSAPVPNQPAELREAISRKIGVSRPRPALHVHRIPDRPALPIRTTHTKPAPGPIMGTWGRA